LSPDFQSGSIIDLFFSPGGSRPPTTNIYNDYIDSLPLHAMKGGRRAVGLTYLMML
jgi:hypothetical protein